MFMCLNICKILETEVVVKANMYLDAGAMLLAVVPREGCCLYILGVPKAKMSNRVFAESQ